MKTQSSVLVCALGMFALFGAKQAQAQTAASIGTSATSTRTENSCLHDCSAQAKSMIAECLAAGGSRRECLARGREFERTCRRQCDQPATCEEKCQEVARSVRARCLEAGGTTEQCDAAAREALQACIAANCQPPASCEDRCMNQAIEAFRHCLAEGIAQEECAMRARMLFHHCVEENCAPADCEERCREEAAMVRRICIESGGTEEQCELAAREFFARCIENHCRPPDCEAACVDRTQHVYRECLEEGGSEEDCSARARHFLAVCLDEHCQPPPPTCEERCHRYARNVHAMCIELGGTPEECEARAHEALAACLAEHCQLSCEDRCRREAHRLFEECIAAGGAQEECAERAIHHFEECVRTHCGAQCGGIAGLPCPEHTVCIFPPGTCDIANNMGVCVPVPEACPRIFEPVCGCDGVTYANACEAVQAGISIDHAGSCGEACGGIQGLPCPEGQFCKFRPGTCDVADNMGICIAIPSACPDVYRPVCGCDGNTYGNACEADRAQVSIAYEGECRQECGGIAGIPCDKGEFCQFPPGTCEVADNMGRCVPIPLGCPDVWEPVCGCDGLTYANACEVAAAGVSIDHPGPCRVACSAAEGCAEGQYCAFPPGACGQWEGVCHQRPSECPEFLDPVCGCDGNTYANHCFAAMAGMSIRHEGPCQACHSNDDCPDAAWCRFADGSCGEATGMCVPRPTVCPDVYMPVCGCNGHTYGNRCEAAAAGVSVRHAGECPN